MNIWTNGCFDIVHMGHIELFKYARNLGDRLIVGIDSDSRIKTNKSKDRPINNEQDRKKFLQSIRYIDCVYIFNNDNELRSLITKNDIDLIVVGDDYLDKYVIGSEYCDVNFFNKIPNYSTTRYVNDTRATTRNT